MVALDTPHGLAVVGRECVSSESRIAADKKAVALGKYRILNPHLKADKGASLQSGGAGGCASKKAGRAARDNQGACLEKSSAPADDVRPIRPLITR